MCGWCVALGREFFRDWGGYDERFVFWCGDIDLARYLTSIRSPPVRVQIPEPLKHVPGQTPRTEELNRDALADLKRYEAKWGSSALVDKTQLRSVDW
jgi:hypothetical protein